MTVLDRPALVDAVDRSAEPPMARHILERLLEAHPELGPEVEADRVLLDAIVAVSVASPVLFARLERDVNTVRLLRADALDERAYDDDQVEAIVGADVPVHALRSWKQRELVRIAARDLLGRATMQTVGGDLADVARVCLESALRIAAPAEPIAIIGMGKLGGCELNYASDVDVLFVHDGDPDAAEHAARSVLRIMSEPGPDGMVFRTDAALRPEGRAGALSRTLESYTAYWERWAQPWELQSLIKAMPVAGDRERGDAFMTRSLLFVWPDVLDPDAVRQIRAMKARTEALLRQRGLTDRELKRGAGGIRDIEFAVQLLQLVHGRADTTVRSANTLRALEQLAAGGYVSHADARQLDDAYVWLRTVEHRLQLVAEQQTHTIPSDYAERNHLARVLGYRDRQAHDAVEGFDTEHVRQRATVRAIHERLFFAPVLETLAGVGALSVDAAEDRLAAFGFQDLEQTRAALRELTAGLTRRSRVIQQLLPAILGWLSAAPDPDLGLLQLRRLSEGYTRSSTLARRFRETPIAAERTCRILGSSRVLGLSLHRHPDVVDALADDAFVHDELARPALVERATITLDWRDEPGRRAGLRRFKRREVLRVGARDLLGDASVASIGRELSHVADACIEAAIASLEPQVPFAVIGLGRLGGTEMSYASDIDVLFVYDGASPADFDHAERLATRLVRAIGESTTEGTTFRVDARLRPEGARGPLARSLASFAAYYERWGQPWEFQVLTKARVVGGDPGVGERFVDLARNFTYRAAIPDDWPREIRRVKARIERERIPPGEDPQFHFKLGRGSLSDIEFTVQLLQLRLGAQHPSVRSTSTLDALDALAGIDALDAEDAEVLRASYQLCERARNYRYLLTGTPGDSLPVDADEAGKLGRMLGYDARPQLALREDYRRLTRRARAVVERVFYGQDATS